MTISAEIYGDPIFSGSGPGFVNRTQSDPGFVNPVRSGPGFVNPIDPIRSGPGLLTPHGARLLATNFDFSNAKFHWFVHYQMRVLIG